MDNLTRVMGIYTILNTVNLRIYVGSSVNISSRLEKHLSNLRHNKHHNSWLQQEWNHFGESAFRCDVLEEVEAIADIPGIEAEWIKRFAHRAYNVQHATTATTPYLFNRPQRPRYVLTEHDRIRLAPFQEAVTDMLQEGLSPTAIVKVLGVSMQVGFAFVRDVRESLL